MQTQVKRARNAMYAIVGVLLLGLGTARAAEPGEACQQKLKSIIVPTIDFENAAMEQVAAFIRRRSKELDPKGEGINMVLKLAPARPVTPAATPDAQADSNRLIVDKIMTKLAVVFFILSPCHDPWNLFLS